MISSLVVCSLWLSQSLLYCKRRLRCVLSALRKEQIQCLQSVASMQGTVLLTRTLLCLCCVEQLTFLSLKESPIIGFLDTEECGYYRQRARC